MSVISRETLSPLAPLPPTHPAASDDAELARRRKLVVNLCQFMVAQLTGKPQVASKEPGGLASMAEVAAGLSPRVRQTLERLMAGDGEKQIAAHLGVSRHTVHVYVKALYTHFKVCTRGELFARVVERARDMA